MSFACVCTSHWTSQSAISCVTILKSDVSMPARTKDSLCLVRSTDLSLSHSKNGRYKIFFFIFEVSMGSDYTCPCMRQLGIMLLEAISSANVP